MEVFTNIVNLVIIFLADWKIADIAFFLGMKISEKLKERRSRDA